MLSRNSGGVMRMIIKGSIGKNGESCVFQKEKEVWGSKICSHLI